MNLYRLFSIRALFVYIRVIRLPVADRWYVFFLFVMKLRFPDTKLHLSDTELRFPNTKLHLSDTELRFPDTEFHIKKPEFGSAKALETTASMPRAFEGVTTPLFCFLPC
jgi:hypothetical protein